MDYNRAAHELLIKLAHHEEAMTHEQKEEQRNALQDLQAGHPTRAYNRLDRLQAQVHREAHRGLSYTIG